MSDATATIGGDIQARIDAIDAELAGIEQSVAPLKNERVALKKSLQVIQNAFGGGSSNGGSASASVTDEQVIEVIAQAGETLQTAQVAEKLGVGPRNVARKLKKLADDGKIAGSKDEGWTSAAA